MILALMIALCLAIGVALPWLIVRRKPDGAGVVIAILATLALAAGAVYGTAQIVGLMGLGDPVTAFNQGLNGWKFLILLAPAMALHTRRQAERGAGD